MSTRDTTPPAWPSLGQWHGNNLSRVAMPLGGIGTGCVSLGGRGDLRDWEIMNRPAKGYTPQFQASPSALVWWQGTTLASDARLLEGPFGNAGLLGSEGAAIPNSQFPRFRSARCEATYPFMRVHLTDDHLPISAEIEGSNPLVPGDAPASSWPLADLRYRITNHSDEPLTIAVCLNLPNTIGCDGSQNTRDHRGYPKPIGVAGNRNTWRAAHGLAGLFLDSSGVEPSDPAWGSMSLTTTATSGAITHRTAWRSGRWQRPLLDFWQDWTADGRLTPWHEDVDGPMASLSVRLTAAPGQTISIPFLIGWHFPNRLSWDESDIIGNHYTTCFSDAWDVALQAADRLAEDRQRSIDFLTTITAGDLPPHLAEAALANASTLRSQTCFRTPDGLLAGWEGTHDNTGSCPGSCTHVWNYEHLTWQLFPDLARGMRKAEFLHATDDDGRMAFRIALPLERNHALTPQQRLTAADGQLGCIVKAWREWRQAGDRAWLASIWPAVRKCMEFCWIPGGWDADKDGFMEGCQHNTMDVEYLGPNPQMQGWYLAALDATADMAEAMQASDFAHHCRTLAATGAARMERDLFEGGWYRQRIQPLAANLIAPGLRIGMSDMDPADPELQLGDGCLIDQLIGPVVAGMAGLAHRLDATHVAATNASILTYNRQTGFHDHFNPFRCYASADDEAILMAAYPDGVERPERPFPYYGEVMTGFEYSLALQLLQSDDRDEAARIVSATRARHNGANRNPFDEIECGHHYARAMASWGLFNAWTGFTWDATTGTITVNRGSGTSAWTAAGTWGLIHRFDDRAEIEVHGPPLPWQQIVMR